jgi:hypothetical protein
MASLQAKCPILAYSNLPLDIIPTLSETSNGRALSFEYIYRYINYILENSFRGAIDKTVG